MGRRTPQSRHPYGRNCCCARGVRARYAETVTASSIRVDFSACVNVSGTTGIEVQINGGAWTAVSGVSGSPGTNITFDLTPTTIDPGDTVNWRYVGGSGTITDCAEGQDIGDQSLAVINNEVLAGNFFLLESGGTDIVLLEDDTDGTRGIQTEDAPP